MGGSAAAAAAASVAPAAASNTSPAENQNDRRDRVSKPGRQKGKSADLFGKRLGAASLGRFVELFEVQVAVVSIIFLDLVASTAQLLPFLQSSGGGGPGAEGGDGGEGSSAGAWAVRLVVQLLQVRSVRWLVRSTSCRKRQNPTASCDPCRAYRAWIWVVFRRVFRGA